jgi:cytosine/adenosine deaminase-related metal-dependent hydrolase
MILMADKIITLTKHVPIINGAIVIHSGMIRDIGKADTIIRKYPGNRVVRMEHSLLMPGLVNAHVHLELPPLPNLIRTRGYTDWVLTIIKTKKDFTQNIYTTAAKQNIAAIMASGTTTVAEICSHNASPAALFQSGLRAVIYQEIISMEQTPRKVIMPRRRRSSSNMKFGLSPHSPHTVSEAVMNVIKSYAAEKRLRICMHVAETQDELRLFQRKKSELERLYAAAGWDLNLAPKARSSFELLHHIGILNPDFLAVHAVHVDARDIAIIRRSGAGIAHCPRSNHEIGVGTMHLKKILGARIPVGLGTDSLASSPSLNLWDEMRYAYQVHRRSGIRPQDIFHMATMGGARALGMDKEIGSLEPGKKADIIAIPLPQKDTGDLYSDLLRETNTCIMSMVNGHVIYHGEVKVKT